MTVQFEAWLRGLRSEVIQVRIAARFPHVAKGNLGDCKPVGQGVFELRYHFGPGYRVYFTRRGNSIILLLAGGEKSTQSRDIATAISLANLENG
ncbi:type II toxin-antitoxin system RelE/ParE family toxin [Gellertiella hungarica]|nr:type II toxin-antitoxin system RelE/ParE family toxin [Gellertiella hungarica]